MNPGSDFQHSTLVLFIQVAFDFEIADVESWSGEEIHIAEDSAEPPEVLAFQVRPI
ncbi:hypothetical protein ES703_18299 [subsurface metagenome]